MSPNVSRPTTTVRIIDNTTHESYSLTVFTIEVKAVAETIERELRQYWRTTRLTDRRHKRRFRLSTTSPGRSRRHFMVLAARLGRGRNGLSHGRLRRLGAGCLRRLVLTQTERIDKLLLSRPSVATRTPCFPRPRAPA